MLSTHGLPDDKQSEERIGGWRPPILTALALAGAGLGFATSVTVARSTEPDAFEDFAVAIATLALLSAVSEAGVGKYGLKVLPRFIRTNRWQDASGYYRYSLGLVVLISGVLSTLTVVLQKAKGLALADYPLGVAVLFLPIAALGGVAVDFVMASLAPLRGSLVARIVVPGTTLILILVFSQVVERLTAIHAVICYGVSSFVGLLVAALMLRQINDARVYAAVPRYQVPVWLRQCGYFAAAGFLASWLFRVPIVILEVVPVAEAQVAYFAAAAEIGCQVLLLAKSTDKLYQPEMSLVIDQRNYHLGSQLRLKRYMFIGTACAVFMSVIVLFGKRILGLYGEEYRAGYPALCLISAGTCTATVFSLAPAYLRFIGRNLLVVGSQVVAAIALVVLTVWLAPRYGATGAAVAFCVVMVTLSAVFGLKASHDFIRFRG